MLCPNLCNTGKFDVLVQYDVTYDNFICPNLGYARKYDVFCPNICYIRKCVMSEQVLHTNARFIMYELMLHTEMYYIRAYVTRANLMIHSEMCNV